MRITTIQTTTCMNKQAARGEFQMKSNRGGFTLIELLAVISIILIASAFIIVGTGGGQGAVLSSSQRIVSGIAQGARGQAILKNARTRLIIHNDLTADVEKYRRFFGIVYLASPDDPATSDADESTWIAATQGTFLPEGIYFDPDLSNTKSSIGSWSDSDNLMNIEYPRNVPKSGSSGPEYFYYEFESDGTVIPANAWLVLRAGILKPDSGGNLDVDFDEEDLQALKAALIFRRAGTTTLVSNPEAID